jgi:hypothetical protein
MRFLHDKRQTGVLALLATLLGAAAVFFGAGGASASSDPCNNEPWGVGTDKDLTVTAGSGPTAVFAGVDPNLNENGYYGTYVCAGAPNGEATQVGAAASVSHPSTDPVGATVQTHQCHTPLPDVWGSCGWLTAPTGAFVDPTTTTNAPGDGDSTSNASAGTGSGTCAHVNSTTPTCPLGTGATLAGVTVREGDLPTVTPTNSTPPPVCTGVNNTCPGAYVIVGGDTGNDTVDTTVAVVGRVHPDVPRTCVQVNSICPT